MKVKDIERMANIAWSPAKHQSILLAAGTAAQQLDASFSTNACLEIYSLNIADPGPEMETKAIVNSENRFHKIVWGSYGNDVNGTIVGGCDNGIIQIYNVSKLLAGESSLVATQNKHTGSVHALDFNSFQGNLLATGAAGSEIYIWDMNNTTTPMTPGQKSQPYEDVVSIQWNRQVQHILASTFVSKCVVWDLRKNEPIIKLTDTTSRIRWKVVAWHPEVATQLCLASEEDQAPIIQLWDLRFATQALKTLENHQRGILSMAWCSRDADLLISSSKDNRILCWNPNSNQPGGEVLSEIAKTSQWNFDITWCPKNPALIASPSFDGHVSVYSLMGGKTQQIQTTNKIADSFPGMDGYLQAPVPQQTTIPTSTDLTRPPKWLKRPIGTKFGFGGKLITFTNEKSQIPQQNTQSGQVLHTFVHSVYISQVITEPDLVNKSAQLEQALEYGNFIDYCRNKADIATDQHKKYIWHFLRANFEENNRLEILNLLGYKLEDVNNKLNQIAGCSNIDEVTDGLSNLNSQVDVGYDEFEKISQTYELKKQKSFEIQTGDSSEGLIAEAILMGNVETAVELCVIAKKYTEAIIIARAGGHDLFVKTQHRYLKENDSSLSSLISALVNEDWSNVVDNCNIKNWKEALVAILTHCNDLEYPGLCERLGNRLMEESTRNPKFAEDAQLCYICSGSFDQLVNSWSKEAKQSTDDLQDLIELVMFLQKAIERQGRTVQITGGLADLLSKYAFILASQGHLQTALNYLGNSTNEQVTELRNRLYISLGQKPAYIQRSQQRTSSTRQSFTSYPLASQSPFTPPAQFTPSYNQFNTNPIDSTMNSHWQQPPVNEPPKPFLPPTLNAPPAQPPRSPSVGSTQGGTGLPSRNKYVVDPSVQSNPMRMNQMNANPLMSSTSMIPNQQMFQSNALSNAFNNNPYATPNPMPPAQPTQLNPINQVTSFVPRSTSQLVSNSMVSTSTPLNPMTPGPASSINSIIPPPYSQNQNTQQFGNIDVGQPALNTLPKTSGPGWNDPPAFTKSSRLQYGDQVQMSAEHSGIKLWKRRLGEPKPEMPPQNPITHPIYGSAPVDNTPHNLYGNQNFMNQTPMYGQPLPQSNFSNVQPSSGPPEGIYNPTIFNTQPINTNNFDTNVVSANVNHQQSGVGHVEKPQPIQKPPIPEEHIHMQTVFNELRYKCSCASNNPQTKRKLEDVSKKLETLYDLLREHKLSPNTLAALHQMVQMIQNGDYTNGLNLHTQLVSGSDFSQIASFMPGIKVLLQCAHQLQVYIR